MRINSPVTNIERQLQDGECVVSQTDVDGRITYVNRPFIKMSGQAMQLQELTAFFKAEVRETASTKSQRYA